MTGAQARIHLCGSLAVELGGRRVETALPGRQGRLAFAYLTVHRDRAIRRDELLDVLWPTDPPKDPDAALRVVLSKLRPALGEVATLEGRGDLRLELPDDAWVDLEAAETAIEDAQERLEAGRWREARERAKLALLVAEQGFLPGLEASWIEERRRRLEEVRLRALECIAAAGLALGGRARRAEAERAARALVAAEPYREPGHRLLMEALAAGGDVAEALRAYDDLRVLLREELGTAPATAVQQLHERLLREGEEAAEPTVAGAEPLPLPPLLAAGGRTERFVGRAAPLARLLDCLARARQGRTQLAFVAGEPGIGKSRLATELGRAAHRQGSEVLYGRSYEDALVPYQPFAEALGHYAAASPAEELRARLGPGGGELARILPRLHDRLPGLPEPSRGDPEAERYRLLEAVALLLRTAAERRPLVLLLDDLHWADDSTLLMLRHVVRAAPGSALLIVGTYREGEIGRGHPLLDTLAELRREQPFETVPLVGLRENEVAQLIAGIVGARSHPALAELVAERTDGNPLFVEEVVRHLSESGALERREGRVTARVPPGEIGVPEGVKQVIAHRLSRLGDAANRALPVAAVVGQGFGFDVLERVADMRGDELVEALEQAAAAGLIVELPGSFGLYSFSHALIRDTLYEQLSAVRRVRLHRRIAEALEAIYEPLFAKSGTPSPA